MPPKFKSERTNGKTLSAGKGKNGDMDKNSDEYLKRRERNNIAVRRSRDKSRKKAAETMKLVSKLRRENEDLEQRVKLLCKELSVLKDLFLTHANGGACEADSVEVNKDALQKDHEYTVSRLSLGTKSEDFSLPVKSEDFDLI